ncbi:hypothetical protein Ccrd_025522 [Cynara cardunculus var. scolymus]|uniref:Uncharacterized protein n=1 Tax=Cynara cardunculus var. scolymus TaxID=59895 RepID=A0A124S7F1_CYNCS|nr:hypothetical protein Ccrd_025522 [Cynara cardunculus var. scolymus]
MVCLLCEDIDVNVDSETAAGAREVCFFPPIFVLVILFSVLLHSVFGCCPIVKGEWHIIEFEELHISVPRLTKLFEVLDGLLGPYWRAIRLAFNCTFLLFGPVIQLIACARYVSFF